MRRNAVVTQTTGLTRKQWSAGRERRQRSQPSAPLLLLHCNCRGSPVHCRVLVQGGRPEERGQGGPGQSSHRPPHLCNTLQFSVCNTGAATSSRHPTVYPPALNTNQHTERDTTSNSIYTSYQDNIESSNNAAVCNIAGLLPTLCILPAGEVRMCGESDLRDRQSQYFCQKLPGESQRRCNNVCNNLSTDQRRSECTPSPQPSHVLSATRLQSSTII